MNTRHTGLFTLLTLCIFIAGTAAKLRAAELDIRNETEFAKAVDSSAKVEKLEGDMQFTEGPVWIPGEGGYLVFSDIPANELKRWSASGGLTMFRKPSGNANGNILDRSGRLITCEHSGRRLSIAEGSGAVSTLVGEYEGKKFNSPNDVDVKSDGTVWFTDPDYGLGQNPKEVPGNYVYCFDPASKKVTVIAKDFDKPNGIAFSPDEKKVYVADSGKPHHIRVFKVDEKNGVTGGEVFATIDSGGPDGIRCDADGRVWSSARDGLHIFAPSGELIGKILVPESPANLCFGGKDGKTLFITARKSLYSVPVKVTDRRAGK